MTKRKILIVDDELDIAKLIVEILQDEGYNVSAVHTGEDGLKKVRELLPDLVLLDWQLPDTEGVDVCRIIKNDPEMGYIPVIMLTFLGSEAHKIRGLEAGADDYITKPFSSGELLARVRATFRRMQREEKVIESKIAQLQKYLPKEMLEKIVAAGPRAQEGEKRIVTVLIADLSGFTAIAEELSAEKVTQLINDCFKLLVDVISQYGGTIDKFIGDAIMALFGAPNTHEDDPSRALYSALMMKHKLKEFNETHKDHLPRPFEIRIGINTGVVVAGSVGSDARLEYTVVGDAVNVTSRLQTAANPGQILISEDTCFYTKDSFSFS
ncbi:MAG: adenylate/guanylate cyclase domain-containing protein [Elusimicrobiota bacterium]|nr:adenylate/guanylate cyclase domain-containing protein [Elusimicrobiota bacterium]